MRKCAYCAFYSEVSSDQARQRYVDALLGELESVAPQVQPRTIFFGGGTPSLLDVQEWDKIFKALQRLQWLGAEEWTLECNPATVSHEKARLWRSFGVNRISLGAQSFVPELLERLGRVHTRDMTVDTFDLLRRHGFDNINLDLIFAIPGQTMQTWRETLEQALILQPEHLSCYELTYEEDTPFFERFTAGELHSDEDLACAMYDELLERTDRAGLVQYEVSNFARRLEHSRLPKNGLEPPALACQHNINYWRGGDYIGLGPSAVSYIGGVRMKNVANTEHYCTRLEQGERPLESQEQLPPLQRAGELAAFGLRMNAGWPLAQFKSLTGYDLCQEWKTEIAHLVNQDWARLDSERLYLTRQGLRFADTVAEIFLR